MQIWQFFQFVQFLALINSTIMAIFSKKDIKPFKPTSVFGVFKHQQTYQIIYLFSACYSFTLRNLRHTGTMIHCRVTLFHSLWVLSVFFPVFMVWRTLFLVSVWKYMHQTRFMKKFRVELWAKANCFNI